MDVQSYTVIYLIAVTGMLFAECLGITWKSIDYENKVLVVDKIWNYKTNLDFASIKQKAVSERYRLTMRHLNCWKTTRKNIGSITKKNRIFSNISNNAVNKTLRRIVGRNVHAHSRRHTYASFLISQRVELLSISKILGHENMNITIEVYSH